MGQADPKSRAKELAEQLGEAAHHVWLAGLGALAKAKDEGGQLFQRLVAEGREVEARGKPAIASLRAQAKKVVEDVRAEAQRAAKTGKEKVKAGVAKAKERGTKAAQTIKKEAEAFGTRIGDLARSVRKKDPKAPPEPPGTSPKSKP
jgi:poly(hydroxyalkanoate) granule-associated protein